MIVGLRMDIEAIIKTIEARREHLKESDVILGIMDYGAGKPHEKRSEQEMHDGVFVHVPLASMAGIGVKPDKAREIAHLFAEIKPRNILELGTCCGFSSAYMSFFAPTSRIHTIEGAESLVSVARENHNFFDCRNIMIHHGRFNDILPDVLNSYAPFDFVFIDGHHDKDATLSYYEQIAPFLTEGGCMMFDDIRWNDDMLKAWEAISHNKLAKDYGKMGAVWL